MRGFYPHNEVCDCEKTKWMQPRRMVINDQGHAEIVNSGPRYYYKSTGIAWHREWMSKDCTIAVGLLSDGTVDEVLFHGAVDCHIEVMSDQSIWMMLNNRYVFHFSYEKGRRVCLHYSYDNEGDD